MVNNSGGVRVETHTYGEVTKNLQGKNDKLLPGVIPVSVTRLQGYKVDTVPSLCLTIILVFSKNWE